MAALAESAVIVSSLWDTLPNSDFDTRVTLSSAVLNALGPAETSQLTAPFVTGALLVISGGAIRLLCFRTLGPFFTVQQVLRKDHRLITSGPYAVVRHPGYISLMMCIGGSCLMYATPGSWLTASRVWNMMWVKAAVGGWCFFMAASLVTLFRRVTEEDRFLAERFGREWEVWAGQVKYKLVPFVY
jgi:protein-S-isoprenylcysteine O-methyltransferase Ste14